MPPPSRPDLAGGVPKTTDGNQVPIARGRALKRRVRGKSGRRHAAGPNAACNVRIDSRKPAIWFQLGTVSGRHKRSGNETANELASRVLSIESITPPVWLEPERCAEDLPKRLSALLHLNGGTISGVTRRTDARVEPEARVAPDAVVWKGGLYANRTDKHDRRL